MQPLYIKQATNEEDTHINFDAKRLWPVANAQPIWANAGRVGDYPTGTFSVATKSDTQGDWIDAVLHDHLPELTFVNPGHISRRRLGRACSTHPLPLEPSGLGVGQP